jgi:hypothetical protein
MPPRILPSQVVVLIDRAFPGARAQLDQPDGPARDWYVDAGHSGTLAALVDFVERIPSELLALDSEHYVELLMGMEAIRTAIGTWQIRGSVNELRKVHGFSNLNPVSLVRRALALCPDQAPSPAAAGLVFIADQQLRDDLRLDISAATSSFADAEWKTATVMAGAVVEALLLWKLNQQPQITIQAKNQLLGTPEFGNDPGNNLESWSLRPLIQVAAHLGVITANTATQAKLAKDFRNLIHPGRAIRLGQKCDRGTALSALAAVEHVVRDLTPP